MENKFWETLKKMAGGLAVTFSVFFLLLTISFFKDNPHFVATNLEKVTTRSNNNSSSQTKNEENLILGKFNLETNGNVIYSYGDGKLYHYKTIKDPTLIQTEKTPRLMLEVRDSQGRAVWKKTEISWIDTKQGIIFFHFKTVLEDGTIKLAQDFTGNYQVFLE